MASKGLEMGIPELDVQTYYSYDWCILCNDWAKKRTL